MGYRIGLDVGIASTGYAVLKTDKNGLPYKILALNSVIYPRAEDPKTGASLAEPRRIKRGLRRRTRRTKFRKQRTQQLFIHSDLLSKAEIEQILAEPQTDHSVYELRVAGLDRRLTNNELFRVLYFFIGHRGFKSNRKAELNPENEADKKQMGQLLNSIEAIKKDMAEKGYRTVGELYVKDAKYSEHKRNKGYNEGYLSTPNRQMLVDEIKQILDKQRELGNEKLTDEFYVTYLLGNADHAGIFQAQRDFDEGPGAGPYAGDQIKKMVGKDIFEPTEDRAAKATYTFQYFNLLQKMTSLNYQNTTGNTWHTLDGLERQAIIDAVFAKAEKPTKTYKPTDFGELRKLLKLPDDARFNLVNYGSLQTQKEIETVEKKTHFVNFKAYHDLVKVLPEEMWQSRQLLDHIGTALTLYSSDKRRQRYFAEELNLPDDLIEKLLPLNFAKFGHLSIKSMQNIIPYLEMGQVYSEATTNAGYDFRKKEISKDTIREEIANPVVRRAVTKTIKVVEQIIRRYGKPDGINIELARELGRNFKERGDIQKRQDKNRQTNDKIAAELTELGIPVNGQSIIRYKLHKEQNGIDPYTGDQIPFGSAFSASYEVDHIIPYSISWDDSYTNKVLTSAKCNREKGNQIPMAYLANNEKRTNALVNVADNVIRNSRKRQKLLKQKLSDEEQKNWKQRNINDTRFITRILYNYFRQAIVFNPDLEKKQRVLPLNGEVTSKIRSRWGFLKVREDGDLHHAIDATVIAAITPTFIQKVTKYSQHQEVKNNRALWHDAEIKDAEYAAEAQRVDADLFNKIFNGFPLPWPEFRDELLARISDNPAEMMKSRSWNTYTPVEIAKLKPVFVVRLANHKISGPVHLDTIRSAKLFDEKGIILSRVSIAKLKLNNKGQVATGDGVYDPENSNNGDKVVYSAIKTVLEAHNGSGELAFPEGYLEYMDHGTKKLVRKVRVAKKSSLPVLLKNKAAADNGSMVRIDVFNTGKKFVFIPIYVKNTVDQVLPSKAVLQGKSAKDWYQITEDDKFCFSLYPGDMVHIESKKGIKPKYANTEMKREISSIKDFYGYFNGANIANGNIVVCAHDNSYTAGSVGIAGLLTFEKYQVDYFGRYHKVHEKKRQSFVKRDE
ncbi:type II CRISPR RNA-guided endonuclease Cas9 [Loigolactobacillus zhaoyuanensis]|uniref:type II CRISPR RNA-guided endonuclease Cas9 n=1 Tax=Loigolactobacillus zhaoyuanensis TaxID=2486017 RepID=UPI000F739666|nr:type II CRISPR RNA-guided endonuclease Cas9 [Loigolactobacillus zhaoyuanensis]